MAFSRVEAKKIATRVTAPKKGVFTPEQDKYIQALLKDIEKSDERVFREARKIPTDDDNPTRPVIYVEGSGSKRVDLSAAQNTAGVPVAITGRNMTGDITITGFDNSYVWTVVYIFDTDSTYSITVANNSEILLQGAANKTLTQFDAITLLQFEQGRWMGLTDIITNHA